jgi:hypothetical protein
MIQPDTALHFIGREMGCGVFACAPIPKGTIVAAALYGPGCQRPADGLFTGTSSISAGVNLI